MHAFCPPAGAPFRRYSLTDEQVEQNGYETGRRWTHKHRPGGPVVFRVNERDDPDFVAYCRTLERHNRLWLQGFDRGLAARK